MKHFKLLFILLCFWCCSFGVVQAQSQFWQAIQTADLVFEGEITDSKSFEKDGTIYTRYTAEVYKNFKNASSSTVQFIALGGQTPNQFAIHSGITPVTGDKGIFIARKKENQTDFLLDFRGAIRYGIKDENIALPNGKTYENSESLYTDFYANGIPFSIIKNASLFEDFSNDFGNNGRVEADLEITSLVPAEITGGTRTKLTINGKGFGDEIGAGDVYFTVNEDGGKTKRQLVGGWWGASGQAEVVSWSDTQIEVYVPGFAGSGTIMVKNNDGDTFESLQTLQVKYSLSTYTQYWGGFPGSTKPEPAQNPDLVNNNGKGGYTLFVDPEFFRNPEMMAAFNRALTTWRCATGINLKLVSSLEKIEFGYTGNSAVNIYDPDFPTDERSFVYSNYQNCNDGKRTHVRLVEFQLFFNQNINWNFSTNAPAADQIDFESEALRLLGKVSQIEYVNDPNDVMYYQLQKGVMKRNLSTSNTEAANIIITQSKEENDCGTAPMQVVASSDCTNSIEAPKARFEVKGDTEFCQAPAKVSFEDFSRNVTAWEWKITGATPETSTEQNPTFEFLNTGNYTVSLTVTGANGEKSTETKTDLIKIATQAVNVDLGADLTICQNQKVTLDAGNDGATYEWSNGATTRKITTSIKGTYEVKVIKGGCSATDRITIRIDASSVIEAGENTQICDGSTAQLEVTGGNGTYRWEPALGLSDPNIANPIASPKETTIYRVYSDSDGDCGQIYDSVRVTVGKTPEIFGLPENGEITSCGEEVQAFLNVYSDQEDITYEWSNGMTESFIEVYEEGEYWVKASSPVGCVVYDTVKVIRVDEINLKVTNDTSFCEGEDGVMLEVSGASYYNWEPREGLENTYEAVTFASPKKTTTYTVTGYPEGFGECEPATAEVTVTVLPKPTLDLGEAEITVCQPEITLNAQNEGSLFQWSDGSQEQTLIVSESGTYFVTVFPKGCTQPLFDSVKVNFPKLDLDLGKDTLVLCETTQILLDAKNLDKEILWSDGSTGSTLLVTASGKYSVTVTDPTCGNFKRDTITVIIPNINLDLPKVLSSCEDFMTINSTKYLRDTTHLSYLWSNGDTTKSITIQKSGKYTLQITSKFCPEKVLLDTVEVRLLKNERLKVDLGENSVKACDSLVLDAGNVGATYLWSDGSTNQTLTVFKDGNYFVSVTYGCGETVTDEINVELFKTSKVDFSFESEGEIMKFTPIIETNQKIEWTWDFGDETNSSEESPSHVFNRRGNYEVTLTVKSLDCEGQTPVSITKMVNVTVSNIEEINIFGKLAVYPNPAQNQLTLKRSKTTENVKIKLTDLAGKTALQAQFETGQSQKTISLRDLPQGVYFLKLETNQGSTVRKIIKE